MKKLAMLSVLLMAGVCLAGPPVVTLSMEVDTVAETFQVFASVTDDGSTCGIAAFELNLWTDGGIFMTSIANEAPVDGDRGFINKGTTLSEDGKTGYVWAFQRTVYSGPNDPIKDSKVLQSSNMPPWCSPLLLVSGTYNAPTPGTLYVDKPEGSNGFSLLKKVTTTGWRGPGNEMAPAAVIPDSEFITPEPATLGLLGLGLLGLRRRQN